MVKKIKVIVADDIEVLIERTVSVLKENENISQIETAKDGRELLEKIEKYEPDIVYTDFKMPKLTGIEVIENIRKINVEKQPIFVLITAERGIEIIQKSRELDFYVEFKPINAERIFEYINNIDEYKVNYKVGIEKNVIDNKRKKENIWKRIFKKN